MFSLLTAAIAPAMALLCFFYLKNEYGSQTFGFVVRTFIIGALLMFPVMVLQHAFLAEGFFANPLLKAFILYGFFEEFFKWFMLYFFAYKHVEFNRRYDGIIFGVSLSLGFASMENGLYLIANGVETALGRALLPVSSHAIYGVIMGYYLGRAKMEEKHRKKWLVLSLFLPVLLHSLYDAILLLWSKHFLFVMVPFMLVLWWVAIQKVKLANQLDR